MKFCIVVDLQKYVKEIRVWLVGANITDTWHEDLLKCMIMALIIIELRKILIIVLEKIKRFSCQIFFLPSIVSFTIQLRKIR
jgi:hypothetical protein